MAREEKRTLTREDLKTADCELLVDELISRLEIDERDARQLKSRLMKAAGYKSRPMYYVEEQQENGRKRRFFGGDDDDRDDDDGDDL